MANERIITARDVGVYSATGVVMVPVVFAASYLWSLPWNGGEVPAFSLTDPLETVTPFDEVFVTSALVLAASLLWLGIKRATTKN